MINYTKKWQLLGCFRRALRVHYNIKEGRVLLSPSFFIEGRADDWKGLANKYPGKGKNKYVIFRMSWIFFWLKEYKPDKLKKRISDLHELYDVCVDENFIGKQQGSNGRMWPTIATSKANRIRGFPLGYLNGLLEEYPKVWIAIGALILAFIGLVGSFWAGIFVGGK